MPNTFINKFYFIDKFDVNNIKNLDRKTSIIYRNYNTINTKEILRIRNICKQKKIKFYLANNLRLAIKYDCDGLYIPSFNNNTRSATSYTVRISCVIITDVTSPVS